MVSLVSNGFSRARRLRPELFNTKKCAHNSQNGLILRLLCIFLVHRVLCLISLFGMGLNTDGVGAAGIQIFELLFGVPIDAKNTMLPY